METDIPNAEHEGDQAERVRGSIFHPLASITIEPQEWLNERKLQLQPVTSSSTTEAGSFQSVCLDESVYFMIYSERAASSYNNNCVLRKCNMKTQSYDKLTTNVEGYALAVYHSKVVVIGGSIPSSSQNQGRAMGDPKYPISVPDDCGLEKKLKSALDRVPQESRYVYKIGKNACAVGEGDLLIVIGGDGTHKNTPQLLSSNQEYVRIFDGQNWSYGVIGITCTTGSSNSVDIRNRRKILLVFQNCIYMTACGDKHSRVFFCCISLECFRSQLDPVAVLSWNLLGDVPDGSPCTNLSVLGNQLVTIGKIDGGFRMYAYLVESSEWITVHEFQLTDMKPIMGIIGLQSTSGPSDQEEALLVGYCHSTRIYKLTTKSQPYNLDSEIKLLALLKLEELANIPVLTRIEENAEKFKDTAGFKLVDSEMGKVRIACEYIEAWKKEKIISYYKPTWRGLLTVLRQIGLNSLALSIDSILRETSPSIEQLVERKDPENVMDMLVGLKESLTELSSAEPSDLQTGAIACASKCNEVLQKFKIEKTDTERELESRKARIEKLTSELTACREFIRALHDRPPGAKYRCVEASDKKDDSPMPKLDELLKELYSKVADMWEDIGILLKIEDGELNKVKSDNAGRSGSCLREMLKIWVKKVNPKPSWSSMAEALEVLGEESLAKHIRETYCSTRN